VAFPDDYVLYPGNSLKQDKHYFKRAGYNTVENGPSEQSEWARQKLSERENLRLSQAIIDECVDVVSGRSR